MARVEDDFENYMTDRAVMGIVEVIREAYYSGGLDTAKRIAAGEDAEAVYDEIHGFFLQQGALH